jgi:hypothetical protein
MGFHFPATEGNDVAFDKVVEKLDKEGLKADVKGFKFTYGKNFENELSYDKTDTFMAKALTHYFLEDNEDTSEMKYFIYTNRYQIAEISKKVDSDEETKALCKKFDSMDMFKVQAVL